MHTEESVETRTNPGTGSFDRNCVRGAGCPPVLAERKFRDNGNSELNKKEVPSRVMPPKNERVELEMQIIKYQQIMSRTTDAVFPKQAEEKLSELERKLRQVDE
jgi:hypothetical protein